MFNKFALDSDMILAFLKDANVTGATVNPETERVVLHVDEGSPDVMFDLSTIFQHYVHKEPGMGLSHNDFTDALKARLLEIKDQVQVDWEQNDPSKVEYIKNKPDLYLPTHTTRDVLDALTEENGELLYKHKPIDSVQSDWNVEDTTAKAYIKNKPAFYLPQSEGNRDTLHKLSVVDGNLHYNGRPIDSVQPDWEQTDTNSKSYIKNKPSYESLHHDNKAILDKIGINANGLMTYNGVEVNTEHQSDWSENDHTKPWFIRNKPAFYLPQSESNREALHSIDKNANGDVTIGGDVAAKKKELLRAVAVDNKFGTIIGKIVLGDA